MSSQSLSLYFLFPLFLYLLLCQFLKNPLLHAQSGRATVHIESITSTCRYTTITQMGVKCALCERHVEAEGDAIK